METLDLKREMLPSKFIIISGKQGAGKTSCATGMICTDYQYHRAERYAIAYDYAARFDRVNNSNLCSTLPQHMYFSSTRILLDPKRGVYTHSIDMSRFALPDPEQDRQHVQYFPKGSFVFISEADMQLSNRDWAKTECFVTALFKFFRKNLMTIIFDLQSGSMIDIIARRLATDLFKIRFRQFRKGFLWRKPRWRWTFKAVDNQEMNDRNENNFTGKNDTNNDIVKNMQFEFVGNVFDRFDTYDGEEYFSYGIERNGGYKVLPHPPKSLRIADLQQYVKMHPITKPPETQKQSDKTKEAKQKYDTKGKPGKRSDAG